MAHPRCLVWIMLLILIVGIGQALAGTVTLAWDHAEGATAYHLYYRRANVASYNQVIDVGYVDVMTITGLTANRRYYFAVTASNDAGESDYSNEVCAYLTVKAPQVRPC